MQKYTWEGVNTNTTQTPVDVAQTLPDVFLEGMPAAEVLRYWLDTAREVDAQRGVIWPEVDPANVAASGTNWQILPNPQIGHAVNNMLCYQARPCGYDPRQMLFRGRGLRAIPFLLLGPDYDSRWATQKGADQPRPTADILAALTSVRTGPSGRSASVPNLAGGPPRTGFRCDSG